MNGKRAVAAALAAAAMLLGCRAEPPAGPPAGPVTPPELYRATTEPPEPPVAHIVRRQYRIREGDVLEVMYHVRHLEDRAYQVKVGDVLDVRFPSHPKLNQRERVQPDGVVYLDLIGRAKVLGRTVEQVRQTLQEAYRKYLKDPVLTVSPLESNVKVRELKQAITTTSRGQSRLAPVTPDGTISLPFVVTLRAAGKTVEELHRDLNAAYAAVGLEEFEVTVSLHRVGPLRVYVLGEVRFPGLLPGRTGPMASVSTEMTLLQALAQAGGHIPARADLSKVMLVRRRHLPRPSAAIVNCFQLLQNRKRTREGRVSPDMSKHKYDIWLEDGDIVYVPPRRAAGRADDAGLVGNRSVPNTPGFAASAPDMPGGAADHAGPNP